MKRDYSRSASFAIVALVYLLAFAAGVLAFVRASAYMTDLPALLLADVVATIVVWLFGLHYENVSVYDPYWSVAPPLMFTVWALFKSCWTLPVILLLVAVWYWGIRLTGNWAYTFKGLRHEDWRYLRYREEQPPLLFHLTNFFGLNMMPTLLVFACMVPGFLLFGPVQQPQPLTFVGFAVCICAASLQLVADTQIHRFRKEHPGQFCNRGLWKHGRHPNYCGEISMWWGVWIMYASLYGLDLWILAPMAMTALFLFISIPMMERRQLKSKPGYAEYRKNTRILL